MESHIFDWMDLHLLRKLNIYYSKWEGGTRELYESVGGACVGWPSLQVMMKLKTQGN